MDDDDHVDEGMLADVLALMEADATGGILRACDIFRTSVPERLHDIGAALHERRLDDAARASHSLRGSAGAFGAHRLGSLGLRLEESCRQADAAGAAALLQEMHAEFAVFRSILDERLARFR